MEWLRTGAITQFASRLPSASVFPVGKTVSVSCVDFPQLGIIFSLKLESD
jgi:hypothetical protein